MKKIIALILAGLILVFAVACGDTNNNNNDDTNNNDEIVNDDPNNNDDNNSDNTNEEPAKAPEEIFNAVVDTFYGKVAPMFGEDVTADMLKSSYIGGYFSDNETSITEGVAGKLDFNDENALGALSATAVVSDEIKAKIDAASLLFYAMRTNNFTAVTLRVANPADLDAVANGMTKNWLENHWDCGGIERYIVVKVDNYVIAAYGLTDQMVELKNAITEVYADAVVVADQDMTEL